MYNRGENCPGLAAWSAVGTDRRKDRPLPVPYRPRLLTCLTEVNKTGIHKLWVALRSFEEAGMIIEKMQQFQCRHKLTGSAYAFRIRRMKSRANELPDFLNSGSLAAQIP